jgi:cell pole-organizing protein PopZ
MEEILASIRRIISDDEANSTRQDAAPEGYVVQPAASEDTEEGMVDASIIADIERGLMSSAARSEPSEDEILDLTDLGGAETAEELVVTEIVEEVSLEPAPSFAQAFPSSPATAPAFQPAPQFEPVPEPQAQEPISPMAPAGEDPTAALERAIEALKAGDLAAFARAAESKYAPPPEPAPSPAAPPPIPESALPSAGPTLAEQFPASDEPQATLEEELVILSEPEPVAPEPAAPVAETSSWPAPEAPAEPEGVSNPWHSDETSWAPKTAPMPDFASPRGSNGGSGHQTHDFSVSESKSLEDSVKEMLRPMLRKWLDENMQRVLTQALREELEDPRAPRRES